MANARNQRGSSQACHLPRVCRGALSLQAPNARAQPLLHSAIRGVQTAHDVESFKRFYFSVQRARACPPVPAHGKDWQVLAELLNAALNPSGHSKGFFSEERATRLSYYGSAKQRRSKNENVHCSCRG